MFNKYRAVFTGPWKALIWSAGVCPRAYCTAPAVEEVGEQVERAKAPPAHVDP